MLPQVPICIYRTHKDQNNNSSDPFIFIIAIRNDEIRSSVNLDHLESRIFVLEMQKNGCAKCKFNCVASVCPFAGLVKLFPIT